MRVLLVEDSVSLQRTLATALRREGYTVDVTGDGRDVLWRIGTAELAGVILDLMIPGIDGLTLLRRLRAGGSRVPVLILTAKAGVDDRVAGLDTGADDYLVKPFALPELRPACAPLARRYRCGAGALRMADLELDITRGARGRARRASGSTSRARAPMLLSISRCAAARSSRAARSRRTCTTPRRTSRATWSSPPCTACGASSTSPGARR